MSLRERIGHWLSGTTEIERAMIVAMRAAGPPIEFHPPQMGMFSGGLGNQPDKDTLLQESLGIGATATRAIANRVSSLNPQVMVTRGSGSTQTDEIVDGHPLKRLLDRPHPNFSRSLILGLMAQWIVSTGEAYLYKVGSRLGTPAELHPIKPSLVEPILRAGTVRAYAVKDGSGQTRELAPELLVRCFWPDPEDPWRAEGYLGPSGLVADSLKFSAQHLRAHYQKNAIPQIVLKALPEAGAMTDAQKERFQELFALMYGRRTGTNIGVPGVLPPGYDAIELAFQSGSEVAPLLEYWRDEQLMAMGVPRSVLGQVVSGDRSSAEVNQWVFDRYTIQPIADMISDALTHQLAGDFDDSIFVKFEPFVSEDADLRLRQERQDLEMKVRTVNKVLEDRGEDPVEWGDLPIGTAKDKVFDPDAEPEQGTLSLVPDIEDDEEMDDAASRRRAPAVRKRRRRKNRAA